MRSAVCGKANGRRCPLFESCGYLAQSHRTHDADVLIVAHEFLFERLPTAVLHDVAYVIIEVDFIPTGDAMPSFPSTCSACTPSAVRPCSIATAKRRRRRQPTCSATRCPIAAMTDGEPEDYVADDALERHHVPQADARYLRYLHRCIPACRSPNGARRSTTLNATARAVVLPDRHRRELAASRYAAQRVSALDERMQRKARLSRAIRKQG